MIAAKHLLWVLQGFIPRSLNSVSMSAGHALGPYLYLLRRRVFVVINQCRMHTKCKEIVNEYWGQLE